MKYLITALISIPAGLLSGELIGPYLNDPSLEGSVIFITSFLSAILVLAIWQIFTD